MLVDVKPKILLLDDDYSFLDVAAFFLDKKIGQKALLQKFTQSYEFIDEIENHGYLIESPEDIIQTFYSSQRKSSDIKLCLKDLSEISAVLVIDHHLHSETTNGIELSKKIKSFSPNSFIILLTAEVGSSKAIELHNHEIIDAFVRKDDDDPMEKICQLIQRKLQQIKSECDIDPQDAFETETLLNEQFYSASRTQLLNEVNYKSYLTINPKGDLAILNLDNQIELYSYENKVFSYNG